jgi:hypothetical protein
MVDEASEANAGHAPEIVGDSVAVLRGREYRPISGE